MDISNKDEESDSSIDINQLASETLLAVDQEIGDAIMSDNEVTVVDTYENQKGEHTELSHQSNNYFIDKHKDVLERTSSEKIKTPKKKRKKRKKTKSQNTRKPQNAGITLSSSLQDNLNDELYIKTDVLVKKQFQKDYNPSITDLSQRKELLKKSVLPNDVEKQHCLPPYEVSLHQARKQRKLERSQTKGPRWFNMKAPEMTQERKNDLTVLKMRNILDPKRFYKRTDISAKPKFFQMGKVVADATDFYSGRIPKKQRKQTLVDELLEDAEFQKYNKRKYAEIVEKNQRSKGAYKHMKRQKKRKR